ncbi:MAG: toll/interleukin-1 receptor domain-containing protein, partial [Verrucomicrobiota bacterium]
MNGETVEQNVKVSEAKLDLPVVFISYSHDSVAHKQWVGELGSRLVKNGVEVILDQWDLGLGDDVPKFMEKSVERADRVLMICTENYVRKADGGKGGVGYEAMVVTGELVRKLETNKFIPVIRQSADEALMPKSVGTRLYVNLSEGHNFEQEFDKLLREIHSAPKLRKPELGKNPFEGEGGGSLLPAVVAAEVKVEDAGAMYAVGLALAQREDLIGWRKLVQKTREPLARNLIAWRSAYEGKPARLVDLQRIVTDGVTVYSPLISLAVAGAVSGKPKFSNQASILDELIEPAGWNGSGMTYLTQIPWASMFTFQAVHGAACVFCGALMKGIEISRARVRDSYSTEMGELFKQPSLVGWPHSLGERPDFAWSYLASLFEKWGWLAELFGSRQEYESSLVAYYLGLHVQELANLIAGGKEAVLEADGHMPLVPVHTLRIGADQGNRSYRMLVHSPEDVRAIWRTLGVKDAQMAVAWDKWLSLTLRTMYRGQGPSWRRH